MMKWNNKKLRLALLLTGAGVISAGSLVLAIPSITQSASSDVLTIQKEQTNNESSEAQKLLDFADPLFADLMKKHHVNGSNFVFVKDGKVLVNKGYGFADKENKIPVDSRTVFQIASISKTFTALAAMQLVDQGKIKLDENIESYLGGLKIPNTTGKPLTMFDLLTYTSGVDQPDITTYVGPEYIQQDIPTREFLQEHMPTVVRPPGEAYTYDNFGFLLAGYAVENVSGQRFDEYMKRNVFEPLGMKSTSVRFTPELLERMAAHYGPTGELQPTAGHAPTDGPQGSILSTGEDMAKYLLMHLQNGKYGNQQLASYESMELMHTYQTFANPTLPIATAGFEGYYKELMNGQHVIMKGGSMPGHASLMVLIPEKNTGFYLSYNNDSLMSVDIYEQLMDHYFPETEKTPQSTYVEISQEEAKPYTGLYRNTRATGIRTHIAYENGKLTMEDSTTGKHTLQMIDPSLFEDELGNKVTFKKSADGQIKYFYYTNRIGLGVVGESEKMTVKAPFDDVPASSKYKTHIDNLHTLGLLPANEDNRFHPKGTMTEGQFADLLIQVHGWHVFPLMAKTNKEQMISGIPGFNRSKPITRQVAAVMIQNLRQAKAETTFTLKGSTDAWAVDAINALLSNGIVDPDTHINQDGSVHFRSKQLLLRQEAAALLDKAFNYYTLPLTFK